MSLLAAVAAAAIAAEGGGAAPEKAGPRDGLGALVEGQVRFQSKTLFGTSDVQQADGVVFIEHIEGAKLPVVLTDPRVAQRNKAFVPGMLVVPAGAQVEFPNEDKVFHNVFSLSRGNEFDLGLYRQGMTKAVKFKKSGVVDVFCNIHPEMVASILVVQNPHWTAIGADGRFTLKIPPGKHTLVAWWNKGVSERREIEVAPGGQVKADFTLVDTGRVERHTNKHGQPYGRYK